MLPIDAICAGFRALGLDGGDPVWIAERLAEGTACTVLTPEGGAAHPTLPVETITLQLEVCHPSQQTAHERAWAAYRALHRHDLWTLDGWTALGLFADAPPSVLPSLVAGNGPLYRVGFRLRGTFVEHSAS